MLYVSDIGAGSIYRYDIAPDGGLSGKTLAVTRGSDGMTLDNEGNLYLTGDGVMVFDNKGRQIDHIRLSDEQWTATSALPARIDARCSSRQAPGCTESGCA